jgi:hypothetical protein
MKTILALAMAVSVPIGAWAVIVTGQQVSSTEWTYTVTYEPFDNYAVCPPPENVATITLTGLSGVTSATAPTSTDIDTVFSDQTSITLFNSLNLAWVPEVLNGGTKVRWTHLGSGTGNFSIPLHVFGFKVVTAAPARNGTVNVATDGFSFDVSGSVPCLVQPADDRDFIGSTEGPIGPTIVQVWLEIKPSINPRSKGVIPLAILTTETFDVTTVDAATIHFGSTGTEATPVQFAWKDVDGDGRFDLLLHFETQSTGIRCGDLSASLTGQTSSGQLIQGAHSIKTVGCK